jgi:hypothetical protein
LGLSGLLTRAQPGRIGFKKVKDSGSTPTNNGRLPTCLGYLDAETIYRSNIDLSLKPRCTDSGKQWIDDFEYKFPLLDATKTIMELQDGLNDFYKGRSNPSIAMFPAQRIVRLGIGGTS